MCAAKRATQYGFKAELGSWCSFLQRAQPWLACACQHGATESTLDAESLADGNAMVQGKDTTTIILGEVVRYHIHEGVADKTPSGHTIVDPFKLQPVSRLGGNMCAAHAPCLAHVYGALAPWQWWRAAP
jgi:hypothetical protein